VSAHDPLIVPVEVAAMVLNDPAMNILRARMNYARLADSASPAPGPFASDAVNFAADPRNRGVYVMWTLPQGLRRRRRSANGETADFPYVPNRWLVVRLFQPAAGRSPARPSPQQTSPSPRPPLLSAWVLQSDGIDDAAGGAAFVDPTRPAALTPTRIGIKTAVTAGAPWREPANPPPYFLRAVAEGNPAFAAFQPFNENVFSLFDNLETQGVGAGTASYYTIGWYSDPTADVLADWTAAGDFAAVLADLGWSADLTAGQTARESVFQGAAFAVQWTPGGPQPPSAKDGVRPSIAIGSTSMDAVVAFARAAFEQAHPPPEGLTPQQAADLIAAFEYDLLPMLGKPGAEGMLASQIRNHWFGSSQGGASWAIVEAEQDPNAAPTPPSAAELAAEAAWLEPLNRAQAEVDELTRELLGVQRQLFALWWKQGAAEVYREQSGHSALPWGITASAQFPPALDALANRARALLGEIAKREASIPAGSATRTLAEAIAAFAADRGLPATRMLKQIPAARFWTPVDPVAVISHTAHLMRLDPGGITACRWSASLVSAIELEPGDAAASFTVDATQIASVLPVLPSANLPAVCAALLAELFLLDPANAPQLVAAAGQTLTDTQLLSAALSMSPPRVAPGAGTAAELLPVFPWSQPWRPLYFDWRVQWFPIPFHARDGTPNWAFDGLDYDLVPGRAPASQGRLLEGRTFLTPKPSFEFRARIDKFVGEHPQSPVTGALREIEDRIDAVDAWDFLSQSLSGLGIQLAGWNPVPTSVPDGTTVTGAGKLAELIGDQGGYPPASLLADRQRILGPSTFEGMRAGQLYVERVTLVDAFGQTLEIVKAPIPPDSFARTAGGEVFHPLLADGLVPTTPPSSPEPLRFVQLPPRILQPARLNFDWVHDGAGNPVIGWLLPDHPDASIAAYGPDGTAHGALRLGVDAKGVPNVVWDAAPHSPWPSLPAPSAQLDDFQNMLATLRALGAGALRDFLQSVDESLWSVDPLGARADTFLSVLIGRPLAVVRAAVSLELQSEPWREMAWPYTFRDPAPAPLFLNYQFPVRLGDLGYREDGLVGYFAAGAYERFNCIHLPEREAGEPSLSGYLQPIAPGNYVNVGLGADGRGPAARLTLLMDPRAGVHARCALVPVKEARLPAEWVDGALAGMSATFRTGPALLAPQVVTPSEPGAPDTAVMLPRFAEQRGALTWMERDGSGGWIERALLAVDDTAVPPATAPTLREGLLKLTGGVDS
jgi:hypothetical protein